MKRYNLLLAGVLCWFVTQIVALGLAWGGHGWDAPFLASLPLVIIYPYALLQAFHRKSRSRLGFAGLLVAAAFADVLLIFNATGAEAPYFSMMLAKAPAYIGAWLTLWIGWQAITIVAVIKRRSTDHRRPL